MKYIKIANSDINASEISLGCMRISNMAKQEISTLIHTALDEGINFFDHADVYGGGKSEEKFAEALDMNPRPAGTDDPPDQMRHSQGLFRFFQRTHFGSGGWQPEAIENRLSGCAPAAPSGCPGGTGRGRRSVYDPGKQRKSKVSLGSAIKTRCRSSC